MNSMQKERLDILMTELGLAESRSQAQKLVMAGQVRVDGQLVFKPATKILRSAKISLVRGPRFVSRGGEKLEAALAVFGLEDLGGKVCVDVGASTGGFTDCLLQHGAGKVYAVDVGYGELHWKLRNDPRVVVMERTNARYLAGLPEPVALATIDASFISLKLLLPVVKGWFGGAAGEVVALIKPQFEAGRVEVSRGDGVIHDREIHRRVLEDILGFATGAGFAICGLICSPIKGPKGNTEFLAFLATRAAGAAPAIPALVQAALDQADQDISPQNSPTHLF
jgi:23S rRNA (cytidine1920-2'-O)/16S rRNA (cytidine1409-2'-O)-methyltransferase